MHNRVGLAIQLECRSLKKYNHASPKLHMLMPADLSLYIKGRERGGGG